MPNFEENKHPRDHGKLSKPGAQGKQKDDKIKGMGDYDLGGNKSQSKSIKGQTKKEDSDKKALNIKAKEIWDNYTDEQKRNVYSTYTGIHPKDVDTGGMEYSMLPKYVKMSLVDQAVDPSLGPSESNKKRNRK